MLKIVMKDGTVINSNEEEGRRALRHTASHILAQAVKRLYPNAKLAIGPAIDNGFYYDFDVVEPFTMDILEKIEVEMRKIVKEDLRLERSVVSRKEALKIMEDKGEIYKIELINDLPEGEELVFFKQGDFIELCAGPHVLSTSKVKAFKLLSVAGAYFRGNEKNKMLQRIYGTAFARKSELDEYLNMLEEAKKRDHRKLGKELKLFALMDEGPGFPFFLPNGVVLKNKLIDYWRELHKKNGYVEIETPMILNKELWETSGHWFHYKENMYTVNIDKEEFAIKPMNCPGGMLVYKSETHSYRDLPIRAGELGKVHRHELSGALHGLMRVRAFTQDDAHIFMLPGQIKDEIKSVVKLIDEVYGRFGFKYKVELSTRPENSMGSNEEWQLAESSLQGALEEMNMDFKINEGDGAFYGPKIDFHIQDSIGREWQCGTIQLDLQLPQRFDLKYIGSDGEKHRPIVIHRVIFGSIERFIGILIEHFEGKFPTWLSPVQVKILPISELYNNYAEIVKNKLERSNIRVSLDCRAEKIGYKVREARIERLPYIIVIGEKEQNSESISLRSRKNGDEGNCSLEAFIASITQEIDDKMLDN
ncbi:threonine--tRNA ligase [Clostridium estertheticum]|uniref:threonine--tRNA ligase n=1 Tax=Clostridium estertheticum TaxID=238834 RepID=UPI001CF0EF3B|nr:threonine--tRNA ligase [Clostridium estertheticum]MCB2308297.1 threonine--tRNA ligase [Clostridium estertheticum]MCB2346508.1 threonine--tRNA ligase [Clostridium estertheticum]MCB2349476.1 threonine--tRNA ligase [Clostridium estertheticum]WAG46453.1 threonine--tRNA ligase [Clostridium estertheticum]